MACTIEKHGLTLEEYDAAMQEAAEWFDSCRAHEEQQQQQDENDMGDEDDIDDPFDYDAPEEREPDYYLDQAFEERTEMDF